MTQSSLRGLNPAPPAASARRAPHDDGPFAGRTSGFLLNRSDLSIGVPDPTPASWMISVSVEMIPSGAFDEQRQEALHGRVSETARFPLDDRFDHFAVDFPKSCAQARGNRTQFGIHLKH